MLILPGINIQYICIEAALECDTWVLAWDTTVFSQFCKFEIMPYFCFRWLSMYHYYILIRIIAPLYYYLLSIIIIGFKVEIQLLSKHSTISMDNSHWRCCTQLCRRHHPWSSHLSEPLSRTEHHHCRCSTRGPS